MVDWMPLVSQLKSFVQLMHGDEAGARQTQETFSRQMPIVSQVRSIVEAASGNNDAARQSQLDFVQNLGNVMDVIAGGKL